MSLSQFDPLASIRLFEDAFTRMLSEPQGNRPWSPAVDIFEDAQQITVQAEMPGVSKDTLNVQADRNELLIEGDMQIDMPMGMAALYADLQTTKYRRTFVLSGELETERIEATLRDGLLTVRIPKLVAFRTRKIKDNVP